jgi:hypothetical protein
MSPQEYYPRKITRAYYTPWRLYLRNITQQNATTRFITRNYLLLYIVSKVGGPNYRAPITRFIYLLTTGISNIS